MFLLIDNYDSFTYNLVQAFQVLGQEPVVMKNDDPGLLKLAASPELARVCLSPGPGHPRAAGLGLAFLAELDRLNPGLPVLGVCLGHQLLGCFGGGEIYVADRIMHGKSSLISHNQRGLFAGAPLPFQVGRYHSLLVREAPGRPAAFEALARTDSGELMALGFRDRPWFGVQFHPESVLTPKGIAILDNFLKIGAGETAADPVPPLAELKEPAETPFPLPSLLESLGSGRDLSAEMADQLFGRLMDGELSPAQAGALLLGLRAKGETPVEMAAAARAVLARAVPVPAFEGPCLDVVGAGGDGRGSFNCSTATALIMAGLGYKVVKHGNRSVSSRCGSADVLERLGLDLAAGPEKAPAQLADRNFVFLFAPKYHPAFRHIMPIRREMGIRTIFNLLGPLVNPARPPHSLMGAPRPETLPLMAGALARLGTRRSVVVHGAGGYDEVTPLGPARAIMVEGGRLAEMAVEPAAYGINPCRPEDLAIEGPREGEAALRQLMKGRGPRAMLEMLMLNVALAIYLMRGALSFDLAFQEARTAVLDGAGQWVVERIAADV